MNVLSIFSLPPRILLWPFSVLLLDPGGLAHKGGNIELFPLWLSVPFGWWEAGGTWGQGVCSSCPLPAKLLWLSATHPRGHCPGPSNRALCLCLRAGLGWKGSLLLWVSVEGCTVPYYIFLNPTHTFVNIPFVRFTSIYPIWVYHLFPARILTNRMSSSL